MRLTLALLVLVALIAVAIGALGNQRRTNARTLATATSRRSRAGSSRRSGSSSRRSVIIVGNGRNSSSSRNTYTPSSRCQTTATSCSANSNVCGRWSSTRRCQRFRNRCLMERANCRTTVSSWNVVSLGNCTSIAVNGTGTCTSTFSSTSSTSSTSTSNSRLANILSAILGSSSSSSRVTPIIIRRG